MNRNFKKFPSGDFLLGRLFELMLKVCSYWKKLACFIQTGILKVGLLEFIT